MTLRPFQQVELDRAGIGLARRVREPVEPRGLEPSSPMTGSSALRAAADDRREIGAAGEANAVSPRPTTSKATEPARILSPGAAVQVWINRSLTNVPFAESRSVTISVSPRASTVK